MFNSFFAGWLQTRFEYDLEQLGPWTFEEVDSGYLIAADPVSSGRTHIWYDLNDDVFNDCHGAPIEFVDQRPSLRGQPVNNTLRYWLDYHGGVESECAGGQLVRDVLHCDGQGQ